MKSAGKARSNGLYRHIRTSKEIIRNLLNDSNKHIKAPASFYKCSALLHDKPLFYRVTVHAYVPSNGICRGFAFKYGKFLLPPRFLTALSVPKVPTQEQ